MQWEWELELVERAKEELHRLEAEHPNKYDSLKMDLKAFISDFDDMLQQQNISISSTPTAESSSGRKKRQHDVSVDSKMKRRFKSKTDAVLHKAQQCLHKIQHLKTIL